MKLDPTVVTSSAVRVMVYLLTAGIVFRLRASRMTKLITVLPISVATLLAFGKVQEAALIAAPTALLMATRLVKLAKYEDKETRT